MFFLRQQAGVEIGFEDVQRQVERVQDQIGGFVVGVVAAVAEKQPGFVETADGKAQKVAHGIEAGGGFFKHRCIP